MCTNVLTILFNGKENILKFIERDTNATDSIGQITPGNKLKI
jgi:hypothetical protein